MECEIAKEGLEMIMNGFMGATISKVVSLDTLYSCNNIYVFNDKRTRIKKEASSQGIVRGPNIKHYIKVV
jgi:hypothetical protein